MKTSSTKVYEIVKTSPIKIFLGVTMTQNPDSITISKFWDTDDETDKVVATLTMSVDEADKVADWMRELVNQYRKGDE